MPKQKPHWLYFKGVYRFAVLWDHLIRYRYVFHGVSTDLQWSVYHFVVFSLPFSSVSFTVIYTIVISLPFWSIQSTVLQYSVYHFAVFHLTQFSSIQSTTFMLNKRVAECVSSFQPSWPWYITLAIFNPKLLNKSLNRI